MKEAIKNYIIEKASKIFSEKGFKNTTMDEVANVSDVSKPTLYNYFPSKEELFRKVLDSINREVDSAVFGDINPNDDVFENLRIIILNSFKFLLKRKKIMKIALFESGGFTRNRKKSKLKEFLSDRQRRKKLLLKILNKGKEQGKIRDDLDTEILSIIYLGMMKEISLEMIFFDYDIKDIESLTDNLINIMKNGITRR